MSITDGDEDICVLMVGLIEMRLRERERGRESVFERCVVNEWKRFFEGGILIHEGNVRMFGMLSIYQNLVF